MRIFALGTWTHFWTLRFKQYADFFFWYLDGLFDPEISSSTRILVLGIWRHFLSLTSCQTVSSDLIADTSKSFNFCAKMEHLTGNQRWNPQKGYLQVGNIPLPPLGETKARLRIHGGEWQRTEQCQGVVATLLGTLYRLQR